MTPIERSTPPAPPRRAILRTVSSPAGDPTHQGFTLVEMLFVAILVGILTSMAVPVFSPGRWRSDTAVQELALRLNAAQRQAVLLQHDVAVTFSEDERNVRILLDANNNASIDEGEDERVLDLPETVGFSKGDAPALPQGGAAVTFTQADGSPTLTFHRNGSASASGAVYLRPVEGSMSESIEAVRAVTVERATGEVRCYSYRTGSWEPSC